MDELQFIVERLKEEPFNKAFRAVDFDAKTPEEHLQVFNDVLSSLNTDIKVDVRVAPREQVVEQMVQFLLIHKCEHIPTTDDDEHITWTDELREGKKTLLYSLLHWTLSNYSHLSKRSYLATYLMPVDIPSEIMMDNLMEMLETYKDLQSDFVELHKQYEIASANARRPISEVLHDIKQLDLEKQQLLHRLEHEKAHASNIPNFQLLLDRTNQMRQAQDDEIRLQEQKKEQLQCMTVAKQRLQQTRHVFDVLRTMSDGEKPVDDILNELEHEARKSVNHLEMNTMREHRKLELQLLQTEKEALGSIQTENDIEQLEDTALRLEDTLNRKQMELQSLSRQNKNTSKLSVFKQHVNAATSKLRSKQEAAEKKLAEKELLISSNQKLRHSIVELEESLEEICRPDGTSMKRHEFKDFQENLANKLKRYEDSRIEIETMRRENLVKKRTEEILKSRHHNLEEFLKAEEERAGVIGFRDTNDQLEQASKQTIALNKLKSQTLEEISATVKKIAFTLEETKRELEPKVQELKQTRQKFQELLERHDSKKARYGKLSNKLMNDNKSLESECSRLQTIWLEKDRNYHMLLATDGIMASKINCLTMEEAWRGREEHFLPDFTSLKDFFESKIIQQQGLAKELRKQQSGMRETEDFSSNQKNMFSNLKKMLELKTRPRFSGIDDGDGFQILSFSDQ